MGILYQAMECLLNTNHFSGQYTIVQEGFDLNFYLLKMRYFGLIAYRGTNYFGWQKQPNQISVQEAIEKAISTLIGIETAVVGCGRTDTGVHARHYFLHFDCSKDLPFNFIYRVNKLLGPDIAFYNLFQMKPEAHARFDAYERSYEYHLGIQKDPFNTDTCYYFPQGRQLHLESMNLAAQLLLEYEAFYPFCKSDHNANTLICQISRAEWIADKSDTSLVFHITSNRFLRGMVRLIVGMCINVGLQKLELEEVKISMEQQTRLKKSLSVPPQGLFLKGIKYPAELFLKEWQDKIPLQHR